MNNQLKTYIIRIQGYSGSYAAFEFEADDWRSTNDLFKTWQVDELTSDDAEDKFRLTFGIEHHEYVSARLLSEALEEED